MRHVFRFLPATRLLPSALFFSGLIAALTLGTVVAEPAQLRPWTEYRTIMWIGDTAYQKPEKLPLFFQRLREMGINTAMVHHDVPHPALLEAKMPYYVENAVNKGLCLKWNARVSDWEKHVTAWKDSRDEAGLIREYSFDDPSWQKWARGEMQRLVRANAAHAPIAYDIRDELSVTMSANPFDYDFSPHALAGFRKWLQAQYGTLEKLNAQWETKFVAWDDVKPFTTDQIKNRMSGGTPDALGFPRGKPDWQALQQVKFSPVQARENPAAWNFSPWCDHRTYMDLSLARTLEELRKGAHEIDPLTPIGIEGTQMPSAFGGYDLWRLSQVLDWVEPYDIGNAREIFGSFMPGKPILTTVGEQDGRAAQRRLWHLLLEGDRGCIVWWSEDCIDWKSSDYALTARAQALAPVLKELQSPLARLFMRAERELDPIAIHYSQASIQVDWLLESTVDGSTWLRRFSSYEATANKLAKRRQALLKFFQDCGYTPRFISREQIEHGELEKVRILVFVDAIALSDVESKMIEKFILDIPAKGERVTLGSGRLGDFDPRGKLRDQPQTAVPNRSRTGWGAVEWSQLTTSSGIKGGDSEEEVAEYLSSRTQEAPAWQTMSSEGLNRILPLPVQVRRSACVRIHRYRLGAGSAGARLLAFERNIVWQMSEDLKQAGGNEALEKPVSFEARLSAAAHVYDLRTRKYLGHLDRIYVELDPWHPSLFALTPEKLANEDAVSELAP